MFFCVCVCPAGRRCCGCVQKTPSLNTLLPLPPTPVTLSNRIVVHPRWWLVCWQNQWPCEPRPGVPLQPGAWLLYLCLAGSTAPWHAVSHEDKPGFSWVGCGWNRTNRVVVKVLCHVEDYALLRTSLSWLKEKGINDWHHFQTQYQILAVRVLVIPIISTLKIYIVYVCVCVCVGLRFVYLLFLYCHQPWLQLQPQGCEITSTRGISLGSSWGISCISLAWKDMFFFVSQTTQFISIPEHKTLLFSQLVPAYLFTLLKSYR